MLKEIHVKAGFAWTDELQWTLRCTRRSVERGQGPPRQSAPIPLLRLGELHATEEPLVPLGPIGGWRFVVAGSFFMLREVELSTSRLSHLTFDSSMVSWLLPTSKTDSRAHGVERAWRCLCREGLRTPCPLHALLEQHELACALARRLHGEDFLPSSFPLFPAADGTEVTKAAVVLAVEKVADTLGLPLYTAGGRRRFGGHSMRVTGAQFLAQRGLDLSTIKLLARWSSQVVE
eukprot:4896473-Amphidinium_carterae.1